DGGQRAVVAMRVPEAHRLESVAEDARKAVQPDLAGGVVDAFAVQQAVEPRQAVGAAVAVVAVMEAEEPEAVARQRFAWTIAQASHRQKKKVRGICKAMDHRPEARVTHLAAAEQGPRRLARHAGET